MSVKYNRTCIIIVIVGRGQAVVIPYLSRVMTALSLHQLDSRQHTLYVESSLRIGAVP